MPRNCIISPTLVAPTILELVTIASQFSAGSQIEQVEPYGSGRIHATYLVTTSKKRFILQRVNTQVFQDAESLLHNLTMMNLHMTLNPSIARPGRWEHPAGVQSHTGLPYATHFDDGSIWRAMAFVDRTYTVNEVDSPQLAYNAGVALARFQEQLVGLKPEELRNPLPGYRDTAFYLAQYDAVKHLGTSEQEAFCHNFIAEHREVAFALPHALASGELMEGVIHGDPKINNILLDVATHEAVAVVDFDTVMPGLLILDIGDAVRSWSNRLGEDAPVWEDVTCDLELAEGAISGYLSIAKDFLSANDRKYIVASILVMTYELMVRFFADHLNGDKYFKGIPGSNLRRALVQATLFNDMLRQRVALERIVESA